MENRSGPKSTQGGCYLAPVQFDASTTGDYFSYTWNLGEGTTRSGSLAYYHYFGARGPFTVSLEVEYCDTTLEFTQVVNPGECEAEYYLPNVFLCAESLDTQGDL